MVQVVANPYGLNSFFLGGNVKIKRYKRYNGGDKGRPPKKNVCFFISLIKGRGGHFHL